MFEGIVFNVLMLGFSVSNILENLLFTGDAVGLGNSVQKR